MSMSVADAHAALWLPLLRGLTERVPSWYVWKNAESAFTRNGDIDSAAPREAWGEIETVFREWAAEHGLRHVTACRHIPRTLNLVATSESLPHLLQLEVKGLTTLRGSTAFRAEDLVELTVMDPRGFRRLRPGAEGLFKFIMNGVHRGGAPNLEALEAKGVMPLLESDPDGLLAAARVFGRAETAILAAVASARSGGWDRAAVRKVELHAALRTLAEPHILWERIWFRLARKPFCPLLKVVYREDRELPQEGDAWYARVHRAHA
jgi:hypothetical protein